MSKCVEIQNYDDEIIITSSNCQRDDELTPDVRRVHTFYAIIYSMINELRKRFSFDDCSVLNGCNCSIEP